MQQGPLSQCSKIDRHEKSEEMEKKWKQAEAFDSLVHYFTEQELLFIKD